MTAPGDLTSNPHVARFIGRVREHCSQRATSDRARPDWADSLRAERLRTPELVNLTPADDELIEREIRRGSGT